MQYPKIGIRPVIDGRWGGVRESLEKQTMGMAEAAAALIQANVRYPDGERVQCVISTTTIGGSGRMRPAVCQRKCNCHTQRDTLLVLWVGDL